MKRLLSLFLPFCVFGSQIAGAVVLLNYDINELPALSVQQIGTPDSNVQATLIGEPATFAASFSSTFGESVSRAAPSYSVGWDQDNALGAEIWTNDVSPNEDEFFAFALRAASGQMIDITDASFNWGSTQNGPNRVRVTIDVGNLSTGLVSESLVGDYDLNLGTGNTPAATFISDTINMDATSDVIIFRFYGYGGNGIPASGDNRGGFWDPTGSSPITLNGTVTAIPEPGTAILGLLGAFLCLMRRHRG